MENSTPQRIAVYLIAGEASGDNIGAKLMTALKKSGRNIEFAGIGGDRMIAEGLEPLFHSSELSVMGFTEVLPHIPRFMKLLKLAELDIIQRNPDLVITIDSPGFNFRLAARLAKSKHKLIHYVAPTVWAYKPERAAKVARLYSHIMVILPFEPPYFEREGISCTFVGHPAVEDQIIQTEQNFRTVHNIPEDKLLLCITPGSRMGEIRRHLPIFRDTLKILQSRGMDMHTVIPVIPAVADDVKKLTVDWPCGLTITDTPQQRMQAFAASTMALTKSGTVALELALANVPMIVTHRISSFSAFMLKRMIKVKYVNLINLILNREVVPELLQERCRADLLADALFKLANDKQLQEQQVSAFKEALGIMRLGQTPTPSEMAAGKVLELIDKAGIRG